MDPLQALFGCLQTFTNPDGVAVARCSAINDRIGEITIDTCYTIDAGWETAISLDDKEHFYVVERYENKEKATERHSYWLEQVKKGMTKKELNILQVALLGDWIDDNSRKEE